MGSRVDALCLCLDVIDSNVHIKWNFTANYKEKKLAVQWVLQRNDSSLLTV